MNGLELACTDVSRVFHLFLLFSTLKHKMCDHTLLVTKCYNAGRNKEIFSCFRPSKMQKKISPGRCPGNKAIFLWPGRKKTLFETSIQKTCQNKSRFCNFFIDHFFIKRKACMLAEFLTCAVEKQAFSSFRMDWRHSKWSWKINEPSHGTIEQRRDTIQLFFFFFQRFQLS